MDDEFLLRSIKLDIFSFEHPHTGERIAESIYKCLCDWGIEGKILGMTFDNGPNINLAAKILMGQVESDFKIPSLHIIPFHLRCTAHTIQRIIIYGLQNSCFSIEEKKISIWNLIGKIR